MARRPTSRLPAHSFGLTRPACRASTPLPRRSAARSSVKRSSPSIRRAKRKATFVLGRLRWPAARCWSHLHRVGWCRFTESSGRGSSHRRCCSCFSSGGGSTEKHDLRSRGFTFLGDELQVPDSRSHEGQGLGSPPRGSWNLELATRN